MNRHPGGEEQTIHLLKSIELKKGMKALDLGAGEGVALGMSLTAVRADHESIWSECAGCGSCSAKQ